MPWCRPCRPPGREERRPRGALYPVVRRARRQWNRGRTLGVDAGPLHLVYNPQAERIRVVQFRGAGILRRRVSNFTTRRLLVTLAATSSGLNGPRSGPWEERIRQRTSRARSSSGGAEAAGARPCVSRDAGKDCRRRRQDGGVRRSPMMRRDEIDSRGVRFRVTEVSEVPIRWTGRVPVEVTDEKREQPRRPRRSYKRRHGVRSNPHGGQTQGRVEQGPKASRAPSPPSASAHERGLLPTV